jgi:hypothetical protein
LPEIQLYPNGTVKAGSVTLYEPASPTYAALHQNASPNLLVWGPRGTGKSHWARWHLHRLALQHPNFRYLVVRNSKPELTRTHLSHLPQEMEQLGGRYQSTDAETHYPNGSIGTWAGFDDEKAAMKTLGASYDALLVEEITHMKFDVVVDIASTLRSTKGSGRVATLMAVTNPFGPYSYDVKRRWIDKSVEDDETYDPAEWDNVFVGPENNPFLDFRAYHKRLGGLSKSKRAAWIDGAWSSGEGAFFDFHPERDGQPWHVISRLPEINGRSIYRNEAIPVDAPLGK